MCRKKESAPGSKTEGLLDGGKKMVRAVSGTDIFNQNLNCPYFPCHKGIPVEQFNCKHCYCPLYFIYPDNCGGQFTILPSGVKDCSKCTLPHAPGGHEYVVRKLKEYFSLQQAERDEGTR
jgi:Zn-finger protein